MFKILIVEDEVATSRELKEFIMEEIDDVQVDTALNVPEARALIDAAREPNQPYDAVVLDMMLPSKSGLTATLDESVCHEVRRKLPFQTLVAHITAYEDDGAVKQHLEKVHGPSEIDLSFRLAKETGKTPAEGGYASQLLDRLKPFLYERRIEFQLNSLFGGGGVGAGYSGTFRPRPGQSTADRSKTHELAELTRNIATDWQYLGLGLKTRIKDILKVVENDRGEVTVSLF
jgi:CheY-like chemotaxis protein